MRRRKLIQLAQGGLLGTLTAGLAIAPAFSQDRTKAAPNTGPLTLQWFGHMSFLISGGGLRLLTHPFRPSGCTAGLPAPKADVDYVMISSRLLDEGYLENLPNKTKVFAEPGSYDFKGVNLQGIRMDHDRVGGRRFGRNVAWRWQQAGIRLLHLGCAASPILPDQRILMGRPDVLILPVGGGDKGYSATEAQAVVAELSPKIVVPTYYHTATSSKTCALAPVDEFLALFPNVKVNRGGSTLELSADSLPSSMTIRVFG
ncbi:MBL fold metallo-hydrolase [Tumidithrix helvetica PCC 7403]|uniref:MBL fold metallo-hydrolase n=1 Tax=Tumidithrix helvetica TaxID=3457545 RepID=UPI003C8E051B